MRVRTFAALLTTAVILVASVHLSARITNELTDAKTEVFKVATSGDNGTNWKIMLQGVARKIAD